MTVRAPEFDTAPTSPTPSARRCNCSGPDGSPRWHAEPDDWAVVKDQGGTTTQPIRFQGQWHDDESGLYYNRHRYYDPDTGRYLTQDPIGLNGGLDLYGYVTNPTSMVDPLGLSGAGWGKFFDPMATKLPPPTPASKPSGMVLTGSDYNPGLLGTLFPSSMSAFAKDPQVADALAFQGATRGTRVRQLEA